MVKKESDDKRSAFSLDAGRALRDIGIGRAKLAKADVIEAAAAVARVHAMRNGEVTADDVMRRMITLGFLPEQLGRSMGGLFRGGEWEWTGEFRPSRRVSRHAGMIRVWRLKDANLDPSDTPDS